MNLDVGDLLGENRTMADLIKEEIRCSTLIRAGANRVYDVVATSEGLDSWFTSGAAVDVKDRKWIVFRWKNWGVEKFSGEDGGPILKAERPRRFFFQWHPDNPKYATTVEIRFEAVRDGTVVHLREYGYEDTPEGRRAMLWCATGWGEALILMKIYLEHEIRY